MANFYKNNVIFVDTDNADYTDGPLYIKQIKYTGASGGAATIKDGSSSGSTLWEASGASDQVDEVCIRASNGIWVDITANGETVYIYLR